MIPAESKANGPKPCNARQKYIMRAFFAKPATKRPDKMPGQPPCEHHKSSKAIRQTAEEEQRTTRRQGKGTRWPAGRGFGDVETLSQRGEENIEAGDELFL
ncbi:hypothetical protein CBS63078_11276 [Aspergillus niger]|nr:hypothetical protein CBS63078_11276 [Aspergillus niger]GLA79033.1 hypothetical protein AtubIFM55763_001447 [Aspergillus tubingensis]